MSRPPDDTLVTLAFRFLEGAANPEECSALSARLRADPEARRWYAEVTRQHVVLDEVLRGQSAVPLSRPRLRMIPRRSTGALRWLAAAAAILVLSMSVALAWPSGRGTGPAVLASLAAVSGPLPMLESASGRRALAVGEGLRPGEALMVPPHGGCRLVWAGEATELELGPGRLVVDADVHGARLVLQDGSLRAKVAKQVPGRNLQIDAGLAQVTVIGTKFSIESSPDLVRVQVDEGLVACIADGVRREVGAGSEAEVRRGAVIASGPTPGRIDRLNDFPPGSLPGWGLIHHAALETDVRISVLPDWPGAGVLQVTWTGADPADSWITLRKHLPAPMDATGSDRLAFWFRGMGSGTSLAVGLAIREDGERFVATFRDDVRAWRRIVLPWSEFRRRQDWQPAGASLQGFDPARVTGLAIDTTGLPSSGSWAIDEVQLLYP